MQRRITVLATILVGLALSPGGAATAQTFSSGSTGADGAFTPTANVTVPLPPSGVFNYTTVNIPAGVTVRYLRNAGNTPVTLLASGDVTIAGTIDVSGAGGAAGSGSATLIGPGGGAGGLGGFDGGTGSNGILGVVGGTGLGPGGGGGGTVQPGSGAGAGFGAAGGGPSGGSGTGGTSGPAYGVPELLPLVGGSGGGGGAAGFGSTGSGGGGGGGAIVIASSGTLTLSGSILARGGAGGQVGACVGQGGGGSGGAVRLVATTLTGSNGTINVTGGAGAFNNVSFPCNSASGAGARGRIRLEAFTSTGAINLVGVTPSTGQPTFAVLPTVPTLQIVSVAGVAAPATPTGSFATPDITLPATTTNPVTVALAGANIPPGSVVTVRAQGQVDAVTTASTTLAGTPSASSASASLAIPTNQPCVITATTSFTIVAATGGPVFVQGEAVERVQVTATWGGAAQVAYVTRSGRTLVVRAR